jgi:protein SCO1/2
MPEVDSVPVLRAYASRYHARAGKWDFVTGKKQDLYRLARQGYSLAQDEGDGGEEDFVHTQMLALVDPKGYIRGYYDGTDEAEIQRLIRDCRLLDRQFEYTKEFVPISIINTAINKLRMHGCLKI